MESAGGQLAYQSNETSPISISKRPHLANTNPLVVKRTCLFRFEDRESCEAGMEPRILNQIQEAGLAFNKPLRSRDDLAATPSQLQRPR